MSICDRSLPDFCANRHSQTISDGLVNGNTCFDAHFKADRHRVGYRTIELTAGAPAGNPEQGMAIVEEYGGLFCYSALVKHGASHVCLVRRLARLAVRRYPMLFITA